MKIQSVVTQLKPRVQRLRLVDEQTGFLDEAELTAYVQFAVRYLANRYQLQHFLRIDDAFVSTTAGVEAYTLPPHFGFIAPREDAHSGLALANADGSDLVNLDYYDPVKYHLLRDPTSSDRPGWFTVADNLLYVQPIPDTIYLISAVAKPVRDGLDVPEPYVAAVEIQTLWMMASDHIESHPELARTLPLLGQERTEILRTLVNGEMRFRQQFRRDVSGTSLQWRRRR